MNYRLVRGAARFRSVRTAVRGARAVALRGPTSRMLAALPATGELGAVDVGAAAEQLRRDGLATGLRVPHDTVAELRRYADTHLVYADRDPSAGFRPDQRPEAEATLGKPILVAQYLNALRDCPAVVRLAADPALARIAAEYLGSAPRLVGASLWWTYPVDASEEDRDRHAHRFHRDVDDFAFVKFFFYLTDVDAGDGAHVCVRGSHRAVSPAGRFALRRFADHEVERHYPPDAITEIVGRAGDGFAEDTFCLHKGLTPTRSSRLLLQFEFALFDHGVMHDHREPHELAVISSGELAC